MTGKFLHCDSSRSRDKRVLNLFIRQCGALNLLPDGSSWYSVCSTQDESVILVTSVVIFFLLWMFGVKNLTDFLTSHFIKTNSSSSSFLLLRPCVYFSPPWEQTSLIFLSGSLRAAAAAEDRGRKTASWSARSGDVQSYWAAGLRRCEKERPFVVGGRQLHKNDSSPTRRQTRVFISNVLLQDWRHLRGTCRKQMRVKSCDVSFFFDSDSQSSVFL